MKNNDFMKLAEPYKLYSKMTVIPIEDKHTIFLRILRLHKPIKMLKPHEGQMIIRVARFGDSNRIIIIRDIGKPSCLYYLSLSNYHESNNSVIATDRFNDSNMFC